MAQANGKFMDTTLSQRLILKGQEFAKILKVSPWENGMAVE